MKKTWFGGAALAGMSLVFLVVARSSNSHTADPRVSGASPAVLYYRDPMHPSYTSDRPGTAPDCGMPLVPVYADDTESVRGAKAPAGIKVQPVERSHVTRTLRTSGRIVVDESRVFPVSAGGAGWVKQTFANTATDEVVRRGQPMAVVYGRDFTTAQRTFLYALRASENPPPSVGQDVTALTLHEARLALQDLGFSEADINELARTKQVIPEVTLAAPESGVIIARNAFQNQKFDRGVELFRIADLSHVWVTADVLGADEQYIRSGAIAALSLPNRTEHLRATVADALPHFDGAARTLKVRLDVENPRLLLRPEMLVDLAFDISGPETITIPADAIVESGPRKIVFVDRGDGVLLPRDVHTGWQSAGRVEVTQGLIPGESIAVAGAFLLDSARNMRSGPSGHD
jgi:hypothetical protein